MAGNTTAAKSDKGKGKTTTQKTQPSTGDNLASTNSTPAVQEELRSTPVTTIRPRRAAGIGIDSTTAEIVDDATADIKDAESANDYLLSNNFTLSDTGSSVAGLADAGLRISTLNMPKTVRNAVRSVTLVLKKGDMEVTALVIATAVSNTVEPKESEIH